MTHVALEASAQLTLLLGESGGEKVCRPPPRLTCAANVAEVVRPYAKVGPSRPNIGAMLRPLTITLVSINAALSHEAGKLWPLTISAGGLGMTETSFGTGKARGRAGGTNALAETPRSGGVTVNLTS